MNHVFATIILASGTIASYLAIQGLLFFDRKFYVNKFIAFFAVASSIWSYGFGVLFLQNNVTIAYYCRSVGMSGVFLYLIIAQILIGYISEIKACVRNVMIGFSLTGIGVYFLTILPDEVTYYMSDMGMTYQFKPGLANNIYTLYVLIVGTNMFAISIYMIRKSPTHRLRAFGRYFLITEILIFVGMILDTVFPLLGHGAIPGSTITQFLGLLVLEYAVFKIGHSRITIPNMSEFVYYSLSSPVLVYDVNKRIQIVNEAADDFFAYNHNQIVEKGLSVADLFEVEERRVFQFEGNKQTIETKCKVKHLYCNFTVNKIRDSYGDVIGFILVVTDQTERIKAMKALEEARIEAENANRAKSLFLANMSHEIRTPMNAVIGFSELLLKEKLSDEAYEYVEHVSSSAGNLLDIINDVLDISKIESGKMELISTDFQISKLLGTVCQMIEPLAAGKNLRFETNIDPNIPKTLFGDETKIRGVLINILNNAVKYTNKGTVSFGVSVEKKTKDLATIRYEIKDTGIGIKEEELPLIFDKFSQMDKKINRGTEGTGLGLAIVKGYVELMQGSIRVESEYGKGSCFIVEFSYPIVDDTPMGALSTRTKETHLESAIGEMKIDHLKVLAVDDNPVNLRVAQKLLECYGVEADGVLSGEEAIEACRKENYEIILMDQMMPKMDGIEALKRIRSLSSYYEQSEIGLLDPEGPHAVVIALTANAVSGVREELMGYGFDEYLSKPIDVKELERLLMQFVPKERISYTDSTREKEYENAKEKWNELLGVDTALGMARCGGKQKDYHEVLAMIVNSGQKQMESVNRLATEGKLEDYTILIHAMKGQLYNIGATELGDAAKELETAGKEKNASYIMEQLPSFLEKYQVFVEQINTYLEKQGVTLEAEEEEELIPLLEKIKEQMIDFDFAGAKNTLSKADGIASEEKDRELLSKIQTLLNDVDAEGILSLLETLGI